MTGSIHQRLALSTLLILALFLGLTGYLLQTAQQRSLEAAVEAQLLGLVYALLGEAQLDDDGYLELPEKVADPRLNRPDSGLYAEIEGEEYRWQSVSLLGQTVTALPRTKVGESRFLRDDSGYYILYGVDWEGYDGDSRQYGLRVTLDAGAVDQRTEGFRTTLWIGLLAVAVLLLFLQGLVLRWGLKPLRSVADALKAIEDGEEERVQGSYPAELQPLTGNINSLIEHNRIQQERYRNSLDDLAHSIKTPLAVLQGALDGGDAEKLHDAAAQAVPHIDDIVRGRLKRAALGGKSLLANRVELQALGQRLINTLEKVYRDRSLTLQNQIPEVIQPQGDQNDFMELLGNLLDNACKYAQSTVTVSAISEGDGGWTLFVEDDGPGIADEDVEEVLTRGGRADERHVGQGIGLAAVREIVRLYKGEMSIDRSPDLGGARISISLHTGH